MRHPGADRRRAEWERPRIVAELWWCQDETCDCTMPVVERITPNREAGYPWLRRERLWTGTFHSQAEAAELREQRGELRCAARLCVAENRHTFECPGQTWLWGLHEPTGRP